VLLVVGTTVIALVERENPGTLATLPHRTRLLAAFFAAFRAAGFTDGNALEVILGVSLATLCNFANVFARTPLNDELARYRWQRPGA